MDCVLRFSSLGDGFHDPFQLKSKIKKENGLCVPFQLSGKWIPQSVSLKKKPKRSLYSVSVFWKTESTIRFVKKRKTEFVFRFTPVRNEFG